MDYIKKIFNDENDMYVSFPSTDDNIICKGGKTLRKQFEDIPDNFTTEQTNNKFIIKYCDKVIARIPIGGIITPVIYTITNNLSNATNSNDVTEIEENQSYNATITANEGYRISTIVITMGGNDITSTVYNEGNIIIPNVTGDVVITAMSTAMSIEQLSKPFKNTIFDINTSTDLIAIENPSDMNYLYKINDVVNNEEIQTYSTFLNVFKNYFGPSNLSQYNPTIIKNRIGISTGSYSLIDYKTVSNETPILRFSSVHGDIFGGIISMCNMFNDSYGGWNCYKAKVNMPYINTSNENTTYTPSEKAINSGTLTSSETFKSFLKQMIAYVFEENGEINIYYNGCKFFHFDAPSDFKKWDFNSVTNGIIASGILAMNQKTKESIALLNSSFNENDMIKLHKYLVSLDDVSDISVDIDTLNLEDGDSISPVYDISPVTVKKDDCIVNIASDGNCVDIDGENINAVNNGSCSVVYNSTYKNKTVSDTVNVNVGTLEYTPTPVRTPNQVIIENPINEIDVEEEYSLYSVILNEITSDKKTPYEYSDDNFVKYESLNPSICSVKNGVLKGVSEGSTNIIAKDITGTITTSMPITVVKNEEYVPTENEIYNVSLPCTTTNGVLHIDNTNSEETTKAIQDLLVYCTENNKRKIVFPKGRYLISPEYGSIRIPSNLIIDFNNSDINIEESSKTATGYDMILFLDSEYSKIINANIYGERFTMSATTGHEACQSVVFSGTCYKSGLENCKISQSPGFNIGAKISGLIRCPLRLSNIESGNINDDGTVSDEVVDYCYRSKDYINITSLTYNRFGFGNRQGYEGYSYLSARVYDIYFYDENKQFISCIKSCLQYFVYDKPTNAKYAKIVFYQTFMPTNCEGDFSSVAMIYSQNVPNKCFIRNCILEDNYSTAIQPNSGDNWVIENNIFRRNGYRDPASQIDWEDGRNNIHGHIVRNNTFEDGGAVTFVACSCMVFHNNILKNNSFRHGDEVQNSRIWLNQFVGSKSVVDIKTKTDMVFSQNYFIDGATYTLSPPTNVNFKIHNFENVKCV